MHGSFDLLNFINEVFYMILTLCVQNRILIMKALETVKIAEDEYINTIYLISLKVNIYQLLQNTYLEYEFRFC